VRWDKAAVYVGVVSAPTLAAAALVLYKDLPTLDHDASPCYIMEEKTAQNPSAP